MVRFSDSGPALSTVLVIGRQRRRATTALRRLQQQTTAFATEVVVVDVASRGTPPLDPGGSATAITYLSRPGAGWAAARFDGVKAARAPVVAFIKEHCFAEPG